MTTSVPRLSICIPTYQRAELLDACLASVLPQLEPLGDDVECVISDNASTDATAAVVDRYAREYRLLHFRNASNIGILGNITKVVTQLARGEYVLLIGDDDTMMIGAVKRILAHLKFGDSPALVALNVGYCPQHQRPDASAILGGVDLKPGKLLRPTQATGSYSVEQLLSGPCADFTASYSVVLPRKAWCDEFPEPYLDEPFTCVRNTYPHAYIIATAFVGAQGVLIAEPAVMVFEIPSEEFSWSRYRAINTVLHATKLLQLYESYGVPRRVLAPYYRYQLQHRALFLGDLLWSRDCVGGWMEAIHFAWMQKRYPVLLVRAFAIAMLHHDAPGWLRQAFMSFARLKRRMPR